MFTPTDNFFKTGLFKIAPVLISIFALLLSGGCILTPAPIAGGAAMAADFVTVAQLPQLLEMRIQRQSKWSASLTDELNTILILTQPQKAVFVNGRKIGSSSDVAIHDSRLMIRRSLAMQIGKTLRNPQPLKPVDLSPQQPVSRPTPKIRATVVIDAGHGGKDPGAPNASGPSEKILALDTAKRVADILTANSIKVIMTRTDDTFVELNERAAIANRARADLFVSVHLDTNPNSSITGHTIYIARQPSSASVDLGECIDNRMKSITPGRRGLRNQDYRVLVRTKMPAVLVESGFLSNPTERMKLNNAGHRQNVAKAIALGIIDYLAKK